MRHPTNSLNNLRATLRRCQKIAARIPMHDVDTDAHELKIRSLILLSHAAIEEYLESLSRECADDAVTRLNSSGEVNRPLLSLITYHKPSIAEKFEPSTASMLSEAVEFSANECLQKHRNLVAENHGIKQSHQNKLLFPIGINVRKASPLLPDLLDAFAVKRGGVAHRLGIAISHTKSSILADVRNILNELKPLDKECCYQAKQIVIRL